MDTWELIKELLSARTPGNEMLCVQAVAHLSSQDAKIKKLMDALTTARNTFVVEYGADGKPLTVGYDGNALRPLIVVLDAALTPMPNKEG